MFDWTWVWLVGEVSISYVCYRWWHSRDQKINAIVAAPEIDINHLKQNSPTSPIDYAVVHGIVQPNDTKANSLIKSNFHPHILGVIHRMRVRNKQLEKIRNIWTEKMKVITDVVRCVSFRLVSPSGNYIRIDNPKQFDAIGDHLEVTYSNFEPNKSSPLEKIIDSIVGEVSTGIETTEQMLLVGTPITGVGRLERQSNGIWRIVPHEEFGGTLTQASRGEIISDLQNESKVAKFLYITFAVVSIGTAAYLFHKYYYKHRSRPNQLPRTLPTDDAPTTNTTGDARIRCVICLENEVVYSIQPCSHLGLCHACARTLQTRNQNNEICPICRTPIQQYQRVYLS